MVILRLLERWSRDFISYLPIGVILFNLSTNLKEAVLFPDPAPPDTIIELEAPTTGLCLPCTFPATSISLILEISLSKVLEKVGFENVLIPASANHPRLNGANLAPSTAKPTAPPPSIALLPVDRPSFFLASLVKYFIRCHST